MQLKVFDADHFDDHHQARGQIVHYSKRSKEYPGHLED
jgi:hypothetical protein